MKPFLIGDKVRSNTYGFGVVAEINNHIADIYTVRVKFEHIDTYVGFTQGGRFLNAEPDLRRDIKHLTRLEKLL